MTYNLNINIEDMMIFYYVVENGGFLRAAEALNMFQGKVSRSVASLEKAFGVTLLYRDMRNIKLTEGWHIVFKTAQSMVEMMNRTHIEVQNRSKEASGPVRLTVSTGFGSLWLAKHLPEFRTQYPHIQIHFKTNERGEGNLMMGETDIAITSSHPERRESLMCELLCEYPFYIYASREYLQRKGIPQSIEDLDHHDLIAHEEPLPRDCDRKIFNALLYLGRTLEDTRIPSFIIREMGIVPAVVNGLGLGCMPAFFAQAHPNVERVKIQGEEKILGQHKNQKFIVYPKFLKNLKKHQSLIQFIKEKAKVFHAE